MSETDEKIKESVTNSQSTNPKESSSNLEPEEKWLIRECLVYKDEYKECKSFRGRFHQYFIFGEPLDCNQWKKDYDNCCKWDDYKDMKAAKAVIDSEKNRRMERLRAHYRNDTWKKRESPPSDWDKPLPEWLVKRDENSYLAQKAKDLKEGKTNDASDEFCTIM